MLIEHMDNPAEGNVAQVFHGIQQTSQLFKLSLVVAWDRILEEDKVMGEWLWDLVAMVAVLITKILR